MEQWVADIVNDPDNDYDLTIEILFQEVEIATIRKIDGDYKIIFYPTDEEIQIPIVWLSGLIEKLEK